MLFAVIVIAESYIIWVTLIGVTHKYDLIDTVVLTKCQPQKFLAFHRSPYLSGK